MSDHLYSQIQKCVKLLDIATFRGDTEKVDEIQRKLDKKRAILNDITPAQGDSKYIPYPDVNDPVFDQQLFNKKEFRLNHYTKPSYVNKTYQQIADDACNRETFSLTPNQLFLRNFMSPKTPYNGVLIFAGTGVGKCSVAGTEVLMHDGSIQVVEEIKIGDILMGDDSKGRRVTNLGSGFGEMYKITMEHNESFTVNGEHVLCFKLAVSDDVYEMTVLQYLDLPSCVAADLCMYQINIDFPFQVCAPSILEMPKLDLYEMNSLSTTWYINSVPIRQYLLKLVEIELEIRKFTSIGLTSKIVSQIKFLVRSLGFHCCVRNDVIEIRKHTQLYTFDITQVDSSNYYGFTLDGNNRYILSSLVVTHNTCTAIGIAEQYKNVFTNPCLLLLPEAIKDQFYNQVYNIHLGENQCTGSTYSNMFTRNMSDKEKHARTKQIIRKHYQLMGYQKFGNLIENSQKMSLNDQVVWIRENFSNRLIIIDEVHNVRLDHDNRDKSEAGESYESQAIQVEEHDSEDEDYKYSAKIKKRKKVSAPRKDTESKKKKGDSKVPALLKLVLRYAENVKLVLLSATPMYDKAEEIINIINYLLANDKRKEITNKEVFNKKRELTSDGLAILAKAFKGYVSFMRGFNPFTFPIKLSPGFNNDSNLILQNDLPTHDIYDQPLPIDKRLHDISIIKSVMTERHSMIYQNCVKSTKSSKHRNQPTSIQTFPQVSNMVYPGDTFAYGEKGFDKCFKNIKPISSPPSYDYSNELYLDCLSSTQIHNYSPKIKTIIEYIENSKGIVFVFSYYIKAGTELLAIALEHMGYNRFGQSYPILNDKRASKVTRSHPLSYCTLSGNTSGMQGIIDVLKSDANSQGKLIKVVLGTTVASEGLDFKNIREVHFLDPWYNFSRFNQVVGRALRTCSHASLPIQERNVTVFYHAAVVHDKKDNTRVESDDLHRYRLAQNKAKDITIIEQVLQENAIDCHANINNIRLNANFDIMVSSSQHVTAALSLEKYDRLYMNMKCAKSIDENQPIDASTYDETHYYTELNSCIGEIRSLFSETKYYFTYDQIERRLLAKQPKADPLIIKYALENMLDKKVEVNRLGRRGYLIYSGDWYLFQDDDLHIKSIHLDRKSNEISFDRPLLLPSSQLIPVHDSHQESQVQSGVEKEVTELLSRYSSLHIKPAIFYDYVLDRLNETQTLSLAEHAVKSYIAIPGNQAKFDEILMSFIEGRVIQRVKTRGSELSWFFSNVHRFVNLPKVWPESRNPFTSDDGHLSLMIWKPNTECFEPLKPGHEYTSYKRANEDLRLEYKDISGFVTFTKSSGLGFKIVKQSQSVPTATGSKSLTTGSVCKSNSKLTNAELIHTISSETKTDSTIKKLLQSSTKQDLCIIRELLMRSQSPKTFVRPFLSYFLK